MTSKIVAFVLGIVIGAGICAAVLSRKTHNQNIDSVGDAAALSNRIAGLETSLSSAKAGLQRAQKDNDALAARVQELQQEAARAAKSTPEPAKKRTGLAALFGGDGTNGMSEAMVDMVKSANERQLEARISGMKVKLGLSAEQEQAIRDIMMKQMGFGTEMAQKLFKGELSREELEKMGKEMGKAQPSEEQQIKALLTAEQVAAYDEFEKEERTRMARLTANSELMQIQSQLGLDEAQQDKVFAILADQTLSQFEGKPGDASAALDVRSQYDRKAEALKEVLTPEQFERYKKFQEQQLKMIESFLPKSASNAAVIHVTPIVP